MCFSEPAASGGSDDESNAATDGSTSMNQMHDQMRTPAEPAGSSESGGSGVESIGGASGRSSTCEQQIPRSTEMTQPDPEPSTSTANVQTEVPRRQSVEEDSDHNESEVFYKLHNLRYLTSFEKRKSFQLLKKTHVFFKFSEYRFYRKWLNT